MNIKTIETSKDSFDAFVKKVSRALSKSELGKVTQVTRVENDIVIKFSGLSTSKIEFEVEEREEGFIARFKKEDIAFIHKALRGKVETTLKDIMERLGATVS